MRRPRLIYLLVGAGLAVLGGDFALVAAEYTTGALISMGIASAFLVSALAMLLLEDWS